MAAFFADSSLAREDPVEEDVRVPGAEAWDPGGHYPSPCADPYDSLDEGGFAPVRIPEEAHDPRRAPQLPASGALRRT